MSKWSEWIDWAGGECPLPGDVTTEVRLKNVIGPARIGFSDKWRWEHIGVDSDIIAYRYKIEEAPITDSFMTPEEENEYFNQKHDVDNVNHPPHYQSDNGIECIEAIRAQMTTEQFCAYCQGNVVKYLWRWKKKAGAESLKKAQWYLKKMILEIDDGEES